MSNSAVLLIHHITLWGNLAAHASGLRAPMTKAWRLNVAEAMTDAISPLSPEVFIRVLDEDRTG